MQHSIFLPAATVFLCTFIIIHFSNHLTTSANGERHFLGDIAINCGCFSNSTALDGRRWVGETPLIQPKGKSRSTTISAGNLLTSDPTPFFTARISSTQFSYSFQVNPGQKFLRLHFCPAPYQEGFRNSQDIFSVKANSFTLLQNFSASLAADALGVKYFVKEFCLNVNETGILQITFSASRRISKSSSNTFVFVNGIEIISMPTGLYYTPDDDLGARVIGQSNGFNKVDNNIALELVQRLNVGGGSVLPVEDTGLFRSWSEDVDYMFASSGFQQIKHMLPAPASITPPFLAPLKIYQTSRIFNKGLDSVKKHHVTWKIPVDLGFCYLLRLHFGSFIGESSEGSPTDFSTLIQNDIAESQVNVIKLSGGDGITVYRDYMVMMRGDKADGKSDLSISLQSVDVLNLGLLKGLEIFKLSNIDNSLASPNPSSPIRNSSFWFMKIRNFQVAFGHLNVIMTALTILLAIVNIAFYRLRQVCEHGFVQDKHVQSAPDEPSSHHFSLAEILLATRNFDDALVVGRGGFGKVYKGLVYGRPEVLAIKRLKPDSNQGAPEFWREIETLSKLRHIHLVPLIGYCNESGEMILVYEYMPRGTVADNIYKARMNGKEGIPLGWEQRLRICIGAARGLDYLHTGTQYGVIHRDVKATNILLDENYVAKISDFGLSKLGSTDNTQDQPSTKVWGTVGYLDPHYLQTHKPSITSDVYAFGIVLLVVLSGRPAVETSFFSENVSLLACFQECMEKGEMKDIIDPSMQGEISVESLTKFIEAVVNCVHHLPKKRPSMAQVVVFLEHALKKHQALAHSALNEDTFVGNSCQDGSNQPFEFHEPQVAPITEEKVAYIPVEGGTSNEIQNVDYSIAQKPFWARRWFDLKNIRKTTKKKDHLALGTANILPLKDINSALVPSTLAGSNQPFDYNELHVAPILEQSAASFPVEGNIIKDTQKADLLTNVEVLQPREMVDRHITQESWFSIKDINNPIILSKDIKSATRNFGDSIKIEKRRLYDVYKVFTSSCSRTFEIMQFHQSSSAYSAFLTHLDIRKEVKQHINIVSLLGYCDELNESILVYEYPPYETLDRYLYGKRNSRDGFLSWEQRLRICRDIAHGLHHLHKSLFIHTDLKICNIMLDDNLVPKISSFGFGKPPKPRGRIRDTFSLMRTNQSSSHGVGTPGYLDPYYAIDGMVGKESNVYSFGVILLVVLSGRPAVDQSLPSEQQLLTVWFRECFTQGNLEKIIDPNLKGASLKGFVDLINNCLLFDRKSRPEMAQVVANLEEALDLAGSGSS